MKSPAFQFYPDAWLSSQRVQLMTLEEEGAYIRLLSFCWRHGSIPADPDQAARLAGKGCSTTVATTVLAMFIPATDPTRMVHDRLEEEREKQRIWREKSSDGGKKSAKLRSLSKGGSTTEPRVVQGGRLPNGINQNSTLLSPSLSPSLVQEREGATPPRKRFTPPTLDEVKLNGAKIGIPEIESIKFHAHFETNGWLVGGKSKSPMKSWVGAMTTWKMRWIERIKEQQESSSGPSWGHMP